MEQSVPSRVLVAEDDELTRTFLRHALHTAGLTTVDATNGEQAVALADDALLAAVIIDGLLPDMHGWDLAGK
ncbi:MAG: response regulator, partial [Candidatus Dormibacteria bacterium]